MKSLVIYHADCTDGFAAAFSCWLKLGNGADYHALSYSDKDIPEWRDREVYILDFSFPRPVMDAIFAEAKRVVWCDHHKTAFEMWCGGFEKGATFTEKSYQGLHYVLLNDNKSGALLTWEYFHPDTEVPAFIRHIDDRDRWQFKLEGSRELHAALQSYKPWSFEQWKELNRQLQTWDDHGGDFQHYTFKEGRAILRAQEQNIASMLKQARKCAIKWVPPGELQIHPTARPGLALNAPIHQSEIGHELANQSGTFGLVWHLGADSRVKCSLRSNGEYDVSAIARAFSGGGHRNASGMEIDIETLMGWLK